MEDKIYNGKTLKGYYMKDKEIEVKFIITPEIKSLIIKDLCKDTKEIVESRQIDTYYIPDFRDFEVDGETMECVRIRQTSEATVLAYKRIHRECCPIYCDEYEVRIEDKNNMEKILFALGFKIQMEIDKTRTSFKYENFEFDFDSVKGLGELLEVELKDDDASLDAIFDLVSKYGLSKKDVTYEGIQMLMKKAGVASREP